MLAARLEDAPDGRDESGLEHGVIEAAGLVGGAEIGR